MSLTFFNVKTREKRVAETEPQIAALVNSGDRHPNVLQGQDFGWRLAPETIVELNRIKGNPQELQTIAATYGVLLENVNESHILHFISKRNDSKLTGGEKTEGDFTREYEDEIRKLEDKAAKAEAAKTAKIEDSSADKSANDKKSNNKKESQNEQK